MGKNSISLLIRLALADCLSNLSGMTAAMRPTLLRILALLFPSWLLTACMSPRERCESYEEVEGNRLLCALLYESSASCPARINAGQTTAEKCDQVETMKLLICADSVADSQDCSEEPPWPSL